MTQNLRIRGGDLWSGSGCGCKCTVGTVSPEPDGVGKWIRPTAQAGVLVWSVGVIRVQD